MSVNLHLLFLQYIISKVSTLFKIILKCTFSQRSQISFTHKHSNLAHQDSKRIWCSINRVIKDKTDRKSDEEMEKE